MAGTEQRPDDTEGHGYKWGQDAEAVDEDQATTTPKATAASGPERPRPMTGADPTVRPASLRDHRRWLATSGLG
jgi:hypothetical protein